MQRLGCSSGTKTDLAPVLQQEERIEEIRSC